MFFKSFSEFFWHADNFGYLSIFGLKKEVLGMEMRLGLKLFSSSVGSASSNLKIRFPNFLEVIVVPNKSFEIIVPMNVL